MPNDPTVTLIIVGLPLLALVAILLADRWLRRTQQGQRGVCVDCQHYQGAWPAPEYRGVDKRFAVCRHPEHQEQVGGYVSGFRLVPGRCADYNDQGQCRRFQRRPEETDA